MGVRIVTAKNDVKDTFINFLGQLKEDAKDQYTGFLFRFIEQILAETMKNGKVGYAPVLNLTVYAKQEGLGGKTGGGIELIFHPSRTTSVEIFQKLKMEILGQHLKDALDKYGSEAWGMTPVDERNDVRDMVRAVSNFDSQWGHLAKKANDTGEHLSKDKMEELQKDLDEAHDRIMKSGGYGD